MRTCSAQIQKKKEFYESIMNLLTYFLSPNILKKKERERSNLNKKLNISIMTESSLGRFPINPPFLFIITWPFNLSHKSTTYWSIRKRKEENKKLLKWPWVIQWKIGVFNYYSYTVIYIDIYNYPVIKWLCYFERLNINLNGKQKYTLFTHSGGNMIYF